MPPVDSTHIDFYFDYISHNAWLAWHRLPAVARAHGYHVRPLPVLFAGLLKAYEQLGPAEVLPKLEWMNRNVLRKSAAHGIPLAAPFKHPFNPLFLLRLSAQALEAETLERVVTALFRAIWVDGVDPDDRSAIARCLGAAGLDAEALIAGAEGDAPKARLRANTDEALARGAFGVPTMVVGAELFWGYDDLPWLERFLAGEDPLAAVDLEAARRAWTEARARGQHRRR
jgi:2-hydroxychromene-2-carboxylate isomerase